MTKQKVQLKKACCLLAVFSFVLNFYGISQVNLVSNPSFEEYTICPPSGGNQLCINWDKVGINNTPDYLNTCSSIFSIPQNGAGYQIPLTGNAYCGFFNTTWANPPYREYIGQQLNNNLDSGVKYYVSFYVSLANNMSCGTNNIGILFSTKPYFYNGVYPTFVNRANIYTNVEIIDTLYWIKVSGSFIADSAYQYFAIGNFFDNNNTSIHLIDSSTNNCTAYYYLDNVCISTDSITCNTIVGNNEIKNTIPEIKIIPNPTSNYFYIEVNNVIEYETTIINTLGEEIYFNKANVNEKINISNFKNGIYFIKIKSNKNQLTQKLIINH